MVQRAPYPPHGHWPRRRWPGQLARFTAPPTLAQLRAQKLAARDYSLRMRRANAEADREVAAHWLDTIGGE